MKKDEKFNMITDRLKRLREETPKPDKEDVYLFLATLLIGYGYIGLVGWLFFLQGVL